MSTEEVDHEEHTGFEVAVVGAACRFPGARDLEEYWRVVSEGRETIRRFTAEELIEAGVDPDLLERPNYVPVQPMLGEADLFDAAFFNYSPREAEVIDPQGRLLLELAWETLESAGVDPKTDEGLIGVYVGGRLSTYMLRVYSDPQAVARSGDFGIQVGSDKDYLATRISYKLNLGGPSVSVQTACSTGLVGVHMACQALVAGECDLALAGGASLGVPEVEGYIHTPGGVLSRSGQVRAFDADADGTIFGNGLGMVALRRLEDALADRDQILAVVKGTAVNNDGSHRVGFTAPGVDGQRRVIRAAQIAAEVEADTVTCLEAHGTGTSIGDPIEAEALTAAFRETTDRKGYCALSSVKSNIGHLSAAAGMAGLLKMILALQHRRIPPSINFERPNPQIDFDASPFYVDTELRDWTVDGMPRRAGVSAFGIGGTNAHVILEEAPEPPAPEPSHRERQLVVLSARTPGALAAASANLAERFRSLPDERLADAAYTLQRGRQAFEQRRVLVCRSSEEAAASLADEGTGTVLTGTARDESSPIVFMFSGQGAQYPGMGRGLYRDEPVFREEVDRCAELLESHLDLDLRELLFPEGDAGEAAARLERTAYTQPALFVVEYALASLWRSWGVEPAAMIGHSVGEYVAACLAEVFTLEDALALVAARGRLMEEQPPGDMLAVPLAEDELAERLPPEVSLAAVNAPARSVVSGPAEAVETLRRVLEQDGVACRPLHTSHAFHSGMMEPMLPAFLERFGEVDLEAPTIPFVSNVTGTWITDEEATDPGYWGRHVRHAVRFAAGMETLAAEGERIYLEVGPGKTLASLARQNPAVGKGATILSSMRHPKAEQDDGAFVLESLGRLWLAGARVDWQGFHERETRSRIALPTYPFERRSYWIETAAGEGGFAAAGPPPKKRDPGDWFSLPAWRPSVVPVPETPAGAGTAAEAEDGPETGTWILFARAEGSSAELADLLEARLDAEGRPVVRVEPGSGFESAGEGRFRVGPDADDHAELLAAVEAAGPPARCLVHLWNVGDDALDPEAGPELEPAFWSLLGLAQALGKRGGGDRTRLAVVTSGMQQVAAEAVPRPDRATVLGPVQVIPQESPRVAAAAFDLAPGLDGSEDAEEQARALIAEVESGLPDPVVAYRGAERWVRGVEPVHLAPAAEIPRLRRGGVYLITGGLGGFGRTFADFLAREYDARLVLVGRTPLPERERWDEVEAGADGRTADKTRAVRELEARGAEVLVEAADVTDPESLSAVVRRARERFGGIHGVIHAAGVPGGGMIQLKDREAASRVLAPKVQGTLALERALDGEEPDFLVLCSSTIALLGGFGQVDYCAANSFLDAYARSRRRRGGAYTVSLNWGAWKEVGMAVETALPRAAGGPEKAGPAASGSDGDSAGVDLPPFEGEAIHPLLQRIVEEEPGRTVFATTMASETHWVLDEHRIQGRPAVPGTTYLEMIRLAVEQVAGEGTVEIGDLMFLTPILVPEGTRREVRLALEEQSGTWSVRITSAGRPEGPWTEHARGRVKHAPGDPPEPVDLEEVTARCDRQVIEMTGEELAGAEKLVYWGPRWKSLRRVHLGDGEGVASLELPEEFSADLDSLVLHPALVDVATAVGGGAVAEGSFLPLSYGRVVVHGRLPGRFDCHIRTAGEARRETVTLDVTFLGPEGERLVEVEGFTMKRLGADRLGAGQPAAAPDAAPDEPRTLFGADGLSPEQGVEALRRALAHGRHPQMAISPRDLEWMMAEARKPRTLDSVQSAGDASGRPSHPRPELATPYAPPRNRVEETLAGVWAEALGVEEVGIHDNFFDLGGDSILGIQVITRAGEAGLRLAPELLFEHQTVAELAACVDGAGAGRPAAEVWEEWLREQAEGAWRGRTEEWLGVVDPDRRPDLGTAAGEPGERDEVIRSLDRAAAEDLRDRALPELRATLEEVLLAASAGALGERFGGERLVVRLIGHGHRVAPPELGLDDSADALAFDFPVSIGLRDLRRKPPGELVRQVKEGRRAVPDAGASWAALVRFHPDSQVRDRLASAPPCDMALTVEESPADATLEVESPAAALEVVARWREGRLAVAWTFDPAAVPRRTVEALADEVVATLDGIRNEAGDVTVSPSDFPDADLGEDELEKVLSKVTE